MPKFRVWDNKNRKFIKSPIVWFEDDEVRVFLDISDVVDWVEQTNVEVMQFTGLKDKNGVEIYEGDVVKVYSAHDDPTFAQPWEVYWRSSCWHLRNKSGGYDNGDYYHGDDIYWEDDFCHVEVIGNVYENPELLK